MTTFSQIVDEMVNELKRPDLLGEICSYVNQTIREVHFDPSTGAAIAYNANLQELLITATSESGFGWDVPNPATFQRLEAVKIGNRYGRDGRPVWLRERKPGRGMQSADYFFYRVRDRFVFSDYGGIGAEIALAYYEYPRRLKYYAPSVRPAEYDDVSGWSYADSIVTPELEEAARESVTNWLLMRWHDVLTEGIRAKVYKRVSDTERARTAYSMYSALRQGLYTSEIATSEAAW